MLTTLQTQLIQQALPSYPLTPTQLAHLCLPEPHNSHENQRYLHNYWHWRKPVVSLNTFMKPKSWYKKSPLRPFYNGPNGLGLFL